MNRHFTQMRNWQKRIEPMLAMNRTRRLHFGLSAVCAAAALVASLSAQEHEPNRIHADSTGQQVMVIEDSVKAYLHVFVETSYGWFWQRSTGRAFTTSDKEGKLRTKVDKLCLTLVAHDSITQCVENADSIVVQEKKRGPGIKKRTAHVAAWTEGPNLGPEKMEMKP